MESIDDLWNHIAYVLAYAPHDFPYRDYLAPSEQMTLDLAFEQLRAGVAIAYPEIEFSEKRTELNVLLDDAYTKYAKGERIAAGHLLNSFEAQIFNTE